MSKTPPPLPARSGNRPSGRSPVWPFLARFLMLVIGLGSAVLVWWSINRLPPLARQVREKDATRANLATEVQKLEMDWNAEAARQLEIQYQAALEKLFDGPDAPEKFRSAFLERGQSLALETELTLGAPQAHPKAEHKLLTVPATLRLRPAALGRGLTNSPYERLLNLVSMVSSGKQRVDWMELTVNSDSNSVAQTRAEFKLWSKEKEKAAHEIAAQSRRGRPPGPGRLRPGGQLHLSRNAPVTAEGGSRRRPYSLRPWQRSQRRPDRRLRPTQRSRNPGASTNALLEQPSPLPPRAVLPPLDLDIIHADAPRWAQGRRDPFQIRSLPEKPVYPPAREFLTLSAVWRQTDSSLGRPQQPHLRSW
jgi:hypothetical protein